MKRGKEIARKVRLGKKSESQKVERDQKERETGKKDREWRGEKILLEKEGLAKKAIIKRFKGVARIVQETEKRKGDKITSSGFKH